MNRWPRHFTTMFFLAFAVLVSPIQASFHFARIAEVFTGTAAHPDAQYIVIVPFLDFQTLFASNTVVVTVHDAVGNPQPNFAAFISDLPAFPPTNQRSILVATAKAQDILGISADLVATGSLLPQSGIVCFKSEILLTIPDCVSYGNYLGLTTAGGSEAGPPAPLIPSGAALRRDFGPNGILECDLVLCDDTNNSAADFDVTGPAAENFFGVAISALTVSTPAGVVTLGTSMVVHTVHKTDDPATVRASISIGFTNMGGFVDPNPNQFPGVSYYVVKP